MTNKEVTQMRLGDAIRLGSMATDKALGNEGMTGAARCALGAALFAVGSQDADATKAFGSIRRNWSWTDIIMISPVGWKIGYVHSIIYWLNDIQEWSREDIAAWVDSCDPTPEEQPALEPVEMVAA